MKIQSINCVIPNYSQKSTGNSHAKTTTFSQPSFLATLTPEKIKRFKLEKKLTYLFGNLGTGDVIAVGKNYNEIFGGLKKSLSGFSEMIKRIFFIKHGGLSVPLAFEQDALDQWACINIGDDNISIATEDGTECIEPSDSVTIEDGDVIINNNVNIPIGMYAEFANYTGDIEDLNLLMNPNLFATNVYNLEEAQQKWVEKANSDVLSKIRLEGKATDTKVKKLSFNDVGGMDGVIESLKRSILYPIKFPFAYENVALNHGILLHGKPGTGKTLIAEALAGEANAEFIKICGTDLESKWVGDTESKWRDLFAQAREKQPSILFIDEFDAVVKERGRSAGSDYGDKVVNQILSLMSDLEKSSDNVFVIATTNKPETMDSAVMRSGRFGKQIEVKEPDRKGLSSILDIHTRGKQLDRNLDRESLLDKFEKRKFTGADIKHACNEAHTNSWVRSGIYEKMDAGTLTPEDMVDCNIIMEDFDAVLAEMDKNKSHKTRNPIGYNKQ